MRKALVSALLILCMIMSISGCGEKEVSNGKVTEISIWNNDGSGKALWTEIINEFNETVGKEKGIKITMETHASEYAQTVDVARQNGNLPDLFTATYAQVKEFASKGDIISIEDIEGGKEFAEDYNSPKFIDQNYYNGKIYGLKSTVLVTGLIYNKDLFKKAGIVDKNGDAKPPKTLDEVREYAKKLTDEKNGVYGYSFPYKFNANYTLHSPLKTSFGTNILDLDNLTYDCTPTAKAFEFIMKLKNDNSLFPGAEGLDNDTSRAYFAEGKIGMMAGVSWDVGVLESQFKAVCDWGVVPYPTETGEEKYPRWASLGGEYQISKNAASKPAEKVLEVYKYIYSDEVRAKFYENGIAIPYRENVKKIANEDKIPKQFAEFANICDIEKLDLTQQPAFVVEGDSVATVFSKVYMGTMSGKDAIADVNKRYTEALKAAVDSGKIDVTLYK